MQDCVRIRNQKENSRNLLGERGEEAMEEIIFDDYDECEPEKKSEVKVCENHRYSRGIRKCALALALAVAVSTGFTVVPGKFNNMATVEAARKKDKKKPVIKLSGKSNIRVTQNESVKIPKATAKDNVDGNINKKIKVSVKSGKKSYSALAKKIRKNKAVKFTKTGKYTITYTVSDKAKNKATKKRTVMVVAKQEDKKTTENKTTAERTTESRTTTEQVTTAATTTEIPATEAPTTENVIDPSLEYSKYNIDRVNVNGNYYNVTYDPRLSYALTYANTESDKITINVEHDYDNFVSKSTSGIAENSKYLGYLGKITATDENGKDISNNIVISELALYSGIATTNIISIYVEDANGNNLRKKIYLNFDFADSNDVDFSNFTTNNIKREDFILINQNPIIYARLRQNTESKGEQ